jgi:hypothetical protein
LQISKLFSFGSRSDGVANITEEFEMPGITKVALLWEEGGRGPSIRKS